jgi:O-antigen ligase
MWKYPLGMASITKTSPLERSVLLTLVMTVLAVTPYSVMDPMNLPKMTVLGVMSFLILGLILGEIQKIITRDFRVVLAFTIGFLTLLILNLFITDRNISENFYGLSGRNTGVLTYFSLTILMFASSLISSTRFVRTFRNVLFAIGVFLFIYGCFQFAGLEPFPYVNVYANNVFGTFGNPNFQSAFMGIVGTTAIVSLFDGELRVQSRILVGGISTASIIGIYSTNSWQGFFNLFAGIATGLVLLLFRGKRFNSAYLVLGGSITSGIIVGLGIFNKGPLADLIGKASLEARRLYWESAVQIIKSHPFFGVGFDGFGDWYRRGRSEEAASSNGALVSNSAHNVPLDIGVGGGLPILFIYCVLNFLAVLKIVQMIKSSNNMHVSYISICAAWVSYQAQSLISINQIGLGIIGWILLGLVLGYQPNSEIDHSQKRSIKSNQTSSSFTSFISPIIGLTIGLIVAMPPFVAANKFYSSLKSSDIKVVQVTALQAPLDSQRMLVAAQVFENNKLYKESVEMVREVNTRFPDSFEAWRYLSTLTKSTTSDKQEAAEQMRRLDPFLVD